MQLILTVTQSLLLVFASTSCFCAPAKQVPPSDSGHHVAHHHMSADDRATPESSDCERMDCDGNCGDIAALSTERDSVFTMQHRVDTDVDPGDLPGFAESQLPVIELALLHGPPGDQLSSFLESPVTRHDRALK